MDTDGSLSVLRHPVKAVSARFELCQFKPSHGHNPDTTARYAKVRLRVMRQVHYSLHHEGCIDLVFFVNGIPVATAELKTDFTQSVQDAIFQYRKDRPPKDPTTKKVEPLLTFKRRALVHFAVSTDQVYMTTELAGGATRFLPFNLGNDGAAGNPPNPVGYRTAYLWERVLQRDNWLHILGSFVHLDKVEKDRQGREEDHQGGADLPALPPVGGGDQADLLPRVSRGPATPTSSSTRPAPARPTRSRGSRTSFRRCTTPTTPRSSTRSS